MDVDNLQSPCTHGALPRSPSRVSARMPKHPSPISTCQRAPTLYLAALRARLFCESLDKS